MTRAHIEMLNLTRREAYDARGVTGRITTIFDRFGAETDDIEEAAAVVVAWPDGLFSSVDLSHFDFASKETMH